MWAFQRSDKGDSPRFVSGQTQAYRFLPKSVERFLTPEQLETTMREAGLANVRHRTMSLGTVALHIGERAE